MIARLLLLLLLAGPVQAAESFTLDNGLRVALEEDHRQPWAVVLLCHDAGSRDEAVGEFETAHLFEHLMFRGTKASPGGYSEELRQLGGTENGLTSRDRTCYETRVGSADLHRVLWLEADRMHNLAAALTEEDLESQRAVVKAEILQKYVDDPFGLAIETLRANLFVDHPYAQNTARRLLDLAKADLPRLQTWHQRRYVPGAAWLAVIGDFDLAQTSAWITQTLGAVPDTPPLERPRLSRATGAIKRFAQIPQGENEHQTLLFGWPGPKAGTVDAAALELVAELLTHREGTLFHNVGDKPWYLGASASLLEMDHGSAFVLSVGLTAEGPRRTIAAEVVDAVAELVEDQPDAMVLRDALRSIKSRRLESAGDPMNRAYELLEAWWLKGGIDQVDTLKQRREAVDLTTLARVAGRWLDARGVSVVAISDDSVESDFDRILP